MVVRSFNFFFFFFKGNFSGLVDCDFFFYRKKKKS